MARGAPGHARERAGLRRQKLSCASQSTASGRGPERTLLCLALFLFAIALTAPALGHGVGERDGSFLAGSDGLALGPFFYLGAKHMFTGTDHLLFLAGVIFFLYRLRDVAIYVTLFAVGHSITLILGVLADLQVDAHLVDAVIGLSVVYKAFDNLRGFESLGWRIDPRRAVFGFGLIHGLGLATKLQPYGLSGEGLVANMLSFNVGVEAGQFAALALILIFFQWWRASGRFERHARLANWTLMVAGFVLFGMQMAGFLAQA